jgi:hypothetical protein
VVNEFGREQVDRRACDMLNGLYISRRRGARKQTTSKNQRSCAPKAVGWMRVSGRQLGIVA